MVRFPIAYVTMTTNLYLALHEPSAPPFQMIFLCHCKVWLGSSLIVFSHLSESTPLISFLFPLGLLAKLRMGLTPPVAIQRHLDLILDAFVVVVLGKCNGFFVLIYVMETNYRDGKIDYKWSTAPIGTWLSCAWHSIWSLLIFVSMVIEELPNLKIN